MKILDRYILVTYLKTFAGVFGILMFIFVLQTIWLYISELAGKDLDVEIILRFLLYFSPKLIPLVLPLTILVSSIMVFGTFSEKYEFAAMKSSGISLQRAMSGLMVFIVILSGTAFLFANNVIPYAEYKTANLRRNIAQMKPAVAITEGQFNQVGDITIKVAKKKGDRGQFLEDIIIHKKHPGRPGNFTVIKAVEGELTSPEGSNYLSLLLEDGNYYDEIQPRTPGKRDNLPHTKTYFDRYTINIDLSELDEEDLEEDTGFTNEKMYKIDELRHEIDSLSGAFTGDITRFSEASSRRAGMTALGLNYKPVAEADKYNVGPLEAFPAEERKRVVDRAVTSAKSAAQGIRMELNKRQNKSTVLNKFEIALHEKYVIGISCIILFFVGAPLGAIIRKGGMGLPMVVAIVLFLAYHFIGIFAKNNAQNGVISPFAGTWFSTAIMLPLSVWLTYRATTDQGLFDLSALIRPVVRGVKRLVGLLRVSATG